MSSFTVLRPSQLCRGVADRCADRLTERGIRRTPTISRLRDPLMKRRCLNHS